MDDNKEENHFLSRIPVWDGQPQTLVKHRQDVDWWLEGEDLTRSLNFNLAARYVRQQRGAARARALSSSRR